MPVQSEMIEATDWQPGQIPVYSNATGRPHAEDVATVKRTFTVTLSNILHARIPYPKDDDAKEVHHDTDNRSPSP